MEEKAAGEQAAKEEQAVVKAQATSPEEEARLNKKSFRHYVHEGNGFAVMNTVGENFINPFAIQLGATPALIGFLKSVPQLAATD